MEESRVIRPKNNGGRVPTPTTNRVLRSSAAPIPWPSTYPGCMLT